MDNRRISCLEYELETSKPHFTARTSSIVGKVRTQTADPPPLRARSQTITVEQTETITLTLFIGDSATLPSSFAGGRRTSPRHVVKAAAEVQQLPPAAETKVLLAKTVQVACHEAIPKAMAGKSVKETWCDIVKSKLFEDAVSERVAQKRPAQCPSKKALDTAVSENGACVTGIVNKALDPALKKATQVSPVAIYGDV